MLQVHVVNLERFTFLLTFLVKPWNHRLHALRKFYPRSPKLLQRYVSHLWTSSNSDNAISNTLCMIASLQEKHKSKWDLGAIACLKVAEPVAGRRFWSRLGCDRLANLLHATCFNSMWQTKSAVISYNIGPNMQGLHQFQWKLAKAFWILDSSHGHWSENFFSLECLTSAVHCWSSQSMDIVIMW